MSEAQATDAPSAEPHPQVVVHQTGIPPGLEILIPVDKVFVKQEIEFMEIMFNVECNNRYAILNSLGQRILYAAENTDACVRNLGGPNRPFHINLLDRTGRVVLKMTRACTCGLCLCAGCCGNRIEVKAGLTDEVLGSIEAAYSYCQPTYHILNAEGQTIFLVLGPSCGKCCGWCTMCGTVNFDIVVPDGQMSVGQITKFFSGFTQELVSDADNFGATFPLDLDPRIKAVVLGAVFMIDFMHFEERPDGDTRHRHY